MENLRLAEKALKEVEKELQRYRVALSAAVGDFGDKRRLLSQKREELRMVAIQFYLDEGDHSEDDIAELNCSMHTLEDAMNTAESAQARLDGEIQRLQRDVGAREGDLRALQGIAQQYQQGKESYPETYARAKRDRDRPLLDSTADATSVIQLRTLRDRLRSWASRLGCEDDYQQFLAAVEGDDQHSPQEATEAP